MSANVGVQSLGMASSVHKQATCSQCKKVYCSRDSLRSHWNTTHKKELGVFSCTPEHSHVALPVNVGVGGDTSENEERRVPTDSLSSPSLDPGPLADINSFTVDELEDCKTAPGGRYGLYEAAITFDRYSHDNVKKIWRRISRKGDIYVPLSTYKFPGVSGRATPVATFSQLLEILPHFPGKRAK